MKHVNPDNMSRVELIDHVADLQARIDAMLASSDMRVAHLQRLLGLTGLEAQILELMADGMVRTKEQLMTALYWGRIADGEVPGAKIIDVWVCKARKKLAGTGIVIHTMWGRGYWLEGTDALKKIMAGEPPARDQPSPGPLASKTVGSISRPKGSVLAEVTAWLQKRCDTDGIVRVSMRELSAAVNVSAPANYIRDMEARGRLIVHYAARPGVSRPIDLRWVLELTA